MPRIVILGGGPTGLASAYYLSKSRDWQIDLYEAGSEFGGLARNFGDDGWRFEYGPHNIHTQDTWVLEYLRSFLGDRLKERDIQTLLFIFGKQVKYPLRGFDSLSILRPDQMLLTGFDFFMARLRALLHGIEPTVHFDEWIIRRFGRRLYNIYFGPYVEKVWKADPHEISHYVGEKRIPLLSIRQLIARQLKLKVNSKPHPEDVPNVKSFLPVGGAGSITDHFAANAAKRGARLHAGCAVRSIQLRHGRVTEIAVQRRESAVFERIPLTEDDLVISTLPINGLAEMIEGLRPDVLAAARGLDFTSLVLLHLKIKGDGVFNKSWVYFSDSDAVFNRISEYRHDHLEMVPSGHTSLCVEIPCRKGDRYWAMPPDELKATVMEQLVRYVDIPPATVIGHSKETVEFAYPCFRVNFDKRLLSLKEFLLLESNIISIGRQGLFCYANLDQCIRKAYDMSEAIINDPNSVKYAYQSIFRDYHNTPDIIV